MEFKVIISDGAKTYQKEIKGEEAARLVGLRIGETFNGNLIGESGTLQITGGTDKDGFPMRRGITGSRRIKILVKGGSGFIPQKAGERRKKMVRGDTISENIVQINTKVTTEIKPKKPTVEKKEVKEEVEKVEKEVKEEIEKVEEKVETVTEPVEEKVKEKEKPVEEKVKEKEKPVEEKVKEKEKPVEEKVKEKEKPETKVEPEKPSVPVTEVKGIGKKTAELLSAAGINTVQELLAADAKELSEKTGLSTKQIGNFTEAAHELEG